MEVQPVVKHEPADKWVKGESQSVEEMGEEHHPLMGPRGGDELPLLGESVRDVIRQVSGLPQLFDVSLCAEETIHLPPAPDMAGEG